MHQSAINSSIRTEVRPKYLINTFESRDIECQIYIKPMTSKIITSVAEKEDARDVRSPGQNVFIFMQCLEKIRPRVGWRPLLGNPASATALTFCVPSVCE